MKIGFLGNTNNYPCMLALAFRRMGHDVQVIVSRKDRLHRPESRYSDIMFPYPDWIREIVFPDEVAYVSRCWQRKSAISVLRDCDFVVLNDLGICLASDIGRPCLAMLTGSDLSFYCSPSSEDRVVAGMTTRNPVKRFYGRWQWRRLLERQRAAVKNSVLVYHFARGLIPESDVLLDEIGVTEAQRIFFLMADVGEIAHRPVMDRERLRTFCATRLTWKLPLLAGDSPLDFKGSDVMVRGLGLFWRRHGVPLDIQFVRKGRHIAETIALLREEGLEPQVSWHDEMTQAEVWRQYALADVVFEQFGSGLVTMAGLEAMAAGRPVIGNGRPEIIEPMVGEKSPICQAVDPEGVCRQLELLAFDRQMREEVGRLSREWVERHFAPERAAEQILRRLA